MNSKEVLPERTVTTQTGNEIVQLATNKIQKKRSSDNSKRSSMAPDVSSRFSQDFHKERNSATPDVIPASEKSQLDLERRLKCVLLGDGAVGKTSLIVSYTTNGYPTEYVPTAYDNYSVRVRVDDEPIRLQICDTAGQDEFDHLRPLCYPYTDVFLICFSVVRPTSLCNVRDKWIPEVRKYYPKVPLLLVGTQTDLRTDLDVLVDLAKFNDRPIGKDEADKFAKQHGVSMYVECSALTQKNLKEVFDTSILMALDYREHEDKKKRKRSWKRKKTDVADSCEDEKNTRQKSRVRWKKYFCMT